MTPRTKLYDQAGRVIAPGPALASGGEGAVYPARPQEARAIHDRIRSHARLVLFERAGHMNFPEADPGRYRRVVLDFIRSIERSGE